MVKHLGVVWCVCVCVCHVRSCFMCCMCDSVCVCVSVCAHEIFLISCASFSSCKPIDGYPYNTEGAMHLGR